MTDTYDGWTSSAGEAQRDEALDRVAQGSPDYMAGGMVLIGNLEGGVKVIGEDIRYQCLDAGLTYHHHNVHGSLIKCAVDHGLLIPTGEVRKMRTPHNHARTSAVYWVRIPLPQAVDIVEQLRASGDILSCDAAHEIERLRKLVAKRKK